MYTLETLKLHAARLFVCTLVFIPISLLSTYSHHMVHTLKVYSVHKVFLYYKLYNLNATRNTFGKIIIKCWEYLLKVILLSSVPYTLALVHPTFSLSFSLSIVKNVEFVLALLFDFNGNACKYSDAFITLRYLKCEQDDEEHEQALHWNDGKSEQNF